MPSGEDPNHNTEELKVISFEDQSDDEPENQDTVEKENEGTVKESSFDDEAVIFFSSGTTGPPKGVILTQRSLIAHLSISK